MTSERLGEMFEGDSAGMCAGIFPLVSMGAERRVSRAQTRERGPPSALEEILVRAVLCRQCLTAVGHYFAYFSFFLFFFFLVVTAVAKTPEGVVVGFQIFAWAPK